MDNPAQVSVELSRLFPLGIVAAETTGLVSSSVLTPTELQSIAHCAEKRIRDFAAGRACAHRALSELGIVDFSLLAGRARASLASVHCRKHHSHQGLCCRGRRARRRGPVAWAGLRGHRFSGRGCVVLHLHTD